MLQELIPFGKMTNEERNEYDNGTLTEQLEYDHNLLMSELHTFIKVLRRLERKNGYENDHKTIKDHKKAIMDGYYGKYWLDDFEGELNYCGGETVAKTYFETRY